MFKALGFVLFIWLSVYFMPVSVLAVKKIQYISTEHPQITGCNHKFVTFCNLTSQRYGRTSPIYYVGLHLKTVVAMGNNVTINFYFYEYLSNNYKRSFIEMHFKFCDFLENDNFFGAPVRQGKFSKPCPYPPDDYHAVNMTIDVKVIPRVFPFKKGRIYCNLTLTSTNEEFANGYIDMEIKTLTVKDA